MDIEAKNGQQKWSDCQLRILRRTWFCFCNNIGWQYKARHFVPQLLISLSLCKIVHLLHSAFLAQHHTTYYFENYDCFESVIIKKKLRRFWTEKKRKRGCSKSFRISHHQMKDENANYKGLTVPNLKMRETKTYSIDIIAVLFLTTQRLIFSFFSRILTFELNFFRIFLKETFWSGKAFIFCKSFHSNRIESIFWYVSGNRY